MVPAAARVVIALLGLTLLTGSQPASTVSVARMWDVVESPRWALMVRSVERVRGPLRWSAAGDVTRPEGRFALVVVELTNRAEEPLRPEEADFALFSETGQRYRLRDGADAEGYAALNGLTSFGVPVPPGVTVTMVLIFDVDPRAQGLTLLFRPARDHPVRLDECHCSLPLPTGP